MGAVILDFFATGFFFDDLEVDAFLFGIVTIIALTVFDLPGWNTGRRLVALRCCSAGACCAGWGWLRTAGCALLVACGMLVRGCVARESCFALLRLLRGLLVLSRESRIYALLCCAREPVRVAGLRCASVARESCFALAGACVAGRARLLLLSCVVRAGLMRCVMVMVGACCVARGSVCRWD